MTLSQLIIDLQQHERVVGPDAPVRFGVECDVECPRCHRDDSISETGPVVGCRISAGTIVLES